MADNTTLNPGIGGDIVAADDVAGVKYQRIKLTLGADGVNDGDVSASNPIPVAESGPLLTLFIRLLNLLGAPVGYDKSLGRYRQTTIIESGTVTTVSNQTNIGGVQAQILVNSANLSAWQACVRDRIT